MLQKDSPLEKPMFYPSSVSGRLFCRPGKVIFHDEVTSIRDEATRLKECGVQIVVALGHAGFVEDQRIAAEVSDVDVVIGGHTNTFLYSGKQTRNSSDAAARNST